MKICAFLLYCHYKPIYLDCYSKVLSKSAMYKAGGNYMNGFMGTIHGVYNMTCGGVDQHQQGHSYVSLYVHRL